MRRVPIYLPLLAMVYLSIKAVAVSQSLTGSVDISTIALCAYNDLPLVALVTALALLGGFENVLGITARSSCALIVIWYLVDSLVVILFHARVDWVQIVQYAPEFTYTNEGRTLGIFAGFLIVAVLFTRYGWIAVPSQRFIGMLSLLLMFMPNITYNAELLEFATPIYMHLGRLVGGTAPPFSREEIRALEADKPREPTRWNTSPNIILVLVESMSAADSWRTSGLFHHLDKLDALSERGKIFRNYFANYINTEGGIVSMFGGVPPLEYPGANWDLYRSAEPAGSALRYLPEEYHSVFLASSDLNFRGERQYLQKLGFADLRDLTNTARFQQAAPVVFRSPADEVLFAEALDIVPKLRAPFFLVIETTSSHKPYRHPHGGPNTEAAVWSYVDEQLAALYRSLEASGFLEHGYLLITGDHRRMDLISPQERARYGDCAKFPVPLFIFGPGIQGGTIDERLLQQSDLLRLLPEAVVGSGSLSDSVVLADNYAKPLFGNAPAPALVGALQNGRVKCFSGTEFGAQLEGFTGAPASALKALKRDIASLQHAASAN